MAIQLWDDFEDEFTLFGISSNGADEIKFIYSINQHFKLKFTRDTNFDVQLDDQVYCYSLYSHEMEVDLNPFYIIKNLSHPKHNQMAEGSLFESLDTERYLLQKHKGFDYLLKIPYPLEEGELNPLPLNQAWFVTNYSRITNLSNKEKKLFFI